MFSVAFCQNQENDFNQDYLNENVGGRRTMLKLLQGLLNKNYCITLLLLPTILSKECMSDSVTNYSYVGDTKISVSIKKTNANKCTLS